MFDAGLPNAQKAKMLLLQSLANNGSANSDGALNLLPDISSSEDLFQVAANGAQIQTSEHSKILAKAIQPESIYSLQCVEKALEISPSDPIAVAAMSNWLHDHLESRILQVISSLHSLVLKVPMTLCVLSIKLMLYIVLNWRGRDSKLIRITHIAWHCQRWSEWHITFIESLYFPWQSYDKAKEVQQYAPCGSEETLHWNSGRKTKS